MATFSGVATLSPQDIYTSSATAAYAPGQLGIDGQTGKMFRYALAGASNLVVGNLLQSSAEDTTYENMAVTATAIASNGVQTLNITNGTATITEAQFLGGSVSVYTAGGEAIGYEYTIMGVSGTLTTGGALTVLVDHPIGTAWTTALKVNMKRSMWSGVIQFPASTQTGVPAGGAVYPVTAAQYGWVQTHGIGAVLSDGSTFAVGSEVGTPSGTAGAATVYAAGTTHSKVGMVQQAAAAAHAISLFWQID